MLKRPSRTPKRVWITIYMLSCAYNAMLKGTEVQEQPPSSYKNRRKNISSTFQMETDRCRSLCSCSITWRTHSSSSSRHPSRTDAHRPSSWSYTCRPPLVPFVRWWERLGGLYPNGGIPFPGGEHNDFIQKLIDASDQVLPVLGFIGDVMEHLWARETPCRKGSCFL